MQNRLTVRVLVVDDDREDARLIEDLLGDAKRAQFIVEKAETSAQGLAALEESQFDVVLLDYKLPDGDGLTFLRYLYEELHFKVPVVLITSHGDRKLQVRAIEAGAAEYLEKGTFNTEILERTCIYAIGLYEQQVRKGSGLGVGVNIDTLVSLTRESVKAQMTTASELREMREDFGTHNTAVLAGQEKHNETVMDGQKALLLEIHQVSRLRWALDWIRQNPWASIVLFLCFVIIAVLGVVLINQLDTDKLQTIKNVTTKVLPSVRVGP